MYNLTRDNNGRYTVGAIIKRGIELVSPREFFAFSRKYLGG